MSEKPIDPAARSAADTQQSSATAGAAQASAASDTLNKSATAGTLHTSAMADTVHKPATADRAFASASSAAGGQAAPAEAGSAASQAQAGTGAGAASSGTGASKALFTPNMGPAPMNPYLAGLFLGLTLLASYLILGAGLGASGAIARVAAWMEHGVLPAHTLASAYFGKYFPDPLSYYLVFMFLGVLAGGVLSAATSGRFKFMVERGPTSARTRRLAFALVGGVLSGFAARLAQGCTSGQGLSGGALLLTGSLVFLACLFVTGYLTAWMFRRQWK